MSQPTFSPLLYSDHPSTVRVYALQYIPPPSIPTSAADVPAEFSININVRAQLVSSDPIATVGRTIECFSHRDYSFFPTNYMTDTVVSCMINGLPIPFPLDDIHWESQRLDGVRSTCSRLADKDKLVNKLSDYLCDLVIAPYNAGMRELGVTLVIVKEITLPAEKFTAWTSWYDQQTALNKSFERENEEVISIAGPKPPFCPPQEIPQIWLPIDTILFHILCLIYSVVSLFVIK